MSGIELIELARKHPVMSDGAMGTMLQSHGLKPGACPEMWNVEQPDIVRQVHGSYTEAGARLVSTNTFGGSRLKLDAYGLGDRMHELNRAGSAIAREAAGTDNFVAGSIGPLGKFLEPLGDLTFQEASEVFAEQARALVDGGADVILLETFSDLEEAKAALHGASGSGVPCLCTLAFDTGGRTMMGVDPTTAAMELTNSGASGVGANCGVGPAEAVEIIRQIREATDAIVIVQPNAGVPKIVGGETVFDSSPEEMARYAVEYARLGVNIIGGCCGTTPAHMSAIHDALAIFG